MTQHPGMHLIHLKVLETSDYRIQMSADYTWNHHIGDMVRGARNAASWVLGVFKNRSTSVMLQLYKSLVRCRV